MFRTHLAEPLLCHDYGHMSLDIQFGFVGNINYMTMCKDLFIWARDERFEL